MIGDDGRPLALAGAVLAEVAVGGGEPFPVVGIGGVIVTRAMRGRGLARVVVAAILRLGGELGPDHAMLFCAPQLTPMYAGFGFSEIAAPVRAEQPTGRDHDADARDVGTARRAGALARRRRRGSRRTLLGPGRPAAAGKWPPACVPGIGNAVL